jgi:hypothetical protein
VEVVDECVCSDDECVSTDDIADSDVSEDEKEEVGEPLDLFDSYVQGFVRAMAGSCWKGKKANKKQIKAHKKQNEARLQMSVCYGSYREPSVLWGERVLLWLVLWAQMRLL